MSIKRVRNVSLLVPRRKLGIWLPNEPMGAGESDLWPMCATCMRSVEAYELAEKSEYSAVVTARCRHDSVIRKQEDWKPGHYDARKIEWENDYHPTDDELFKQIAKLKFFEREHIEKG